MFEARRNPDGQARPFACAKARGIIPVRSVSIHDLLVQRALDPCITSIAYVASAQFRGASIFVDAVVLDRGGKRVALDVPEVREPRNVDEDGLILLALSEQGIDVELVTLAQIKAEPLFSNARSVWQYRRRNVPFGLRLQILQVLTEEGPLKLSDLLRSVRNQEASAGAVLSLACADAVEIDLNETVLGPETIVNVRRHADER